ncbi:hypothetical protein EAF04_005535 [Stromatinia cepivora]|nr:hypothetical protein EAF04_005535 [Stromatinia cepivora]
MHLYLKPCLTCDICRRSIIEDEDQVLALLRGPKSYYGHTNAITVPPIPLNRLPIPYGTVYSIDSQVTSWRICRELQCSYCQDSPESSVYHITCLNTISKYIYQVEPRKVFKKICYTSLFFRAWPRAGSDYYCAREPQMTFPSTLSNAIKDSNSEIKGLLNKLSLLPQEIIHIIESFCRDSELWRVWSSLAWSKAFYMKKVSGRLLCELGNWQRGNQAFGPKTTEKFVLLAMDNQGLVEVKFFEQRPVSQKSIEGWWYTCLDTTKAGVRSIRARLKGGRIYLNRRPKDLALWDTPNIPDPKLYFSAGSGSISCRTRTISLNRLIGITFFMSHGAVYAIHPHFGDSPDSVLQTYYSIPTGLRKGISWVFIPLKCCYIQSLYVRTSSRLAGVMSFSSLVLQTNKNQIYLTGLYPHTIKLSKKLKFQSIGVEPSVLMYNDPPSPHVPIQHFGSLTSQQGSSIHIPTRFEFQPSDYHYSMASLENIRAVSTFCDNADGRCRGILIHYHNEDQQVLGQCRHDLVREDFGISLYGFHWQQFNVAYTSYVKVAFSQNKQEMDILRDKGYETALGGEVVWLFDSRRDDIFKIQN